MLSLFLAQVAAELVDYFLVMLVDRAGWHLSHQITIPDNLRRLPQPSGSPELNPAEHLWDDVREHDTANGLFDSLDHLEAVLGHGLNRLASDPERRRSMTNFPYMQISL
jgi:transposase